MVVAVVVAPNAACGQAARAREGTLVEPFMVLPSSKPRAEAKALERAGTRWRANVSTATAANKAQRAKEWWWL